jgi:hypothetical protein
MPAHFVSDICGYRRSNGYANTSDAKDVQSRELGEALFDEMGVQRGRPARGDTAAGTELESRVIGHHRSVRPDLRIEPSRSAENFDQYAHLAVFKRFRETNKQVLEDLVALERLVDGLPSSTLKNGIRRTLKRDSTRLAGQAASIRELVTHMPEESLLKIDVSVAEAQVGRPELLHVALSFKWSLRTDRAQDCVSQGAKLVAQRRGRMPHFGVVTMETRPHMLRILADGSGAVDCVYHPNLPALVRAIDRVAHSKQAAANWPPKRTFDRLMAQGRIRDYDDLVREVERLPGPGLATPEPVPQGGAVDQAAGDT